LLPIYRAFDCGSNLRRVCRVRNIDGAVERNRGESGTESVVPVSQVGGFGRADHKERSIMVVSNIQVGDEADHDGSCMVELDARMPMVSLEWTSIHSTRKLAVYSA